MSTIPPALDHDCPFCGATAGNPCRAHRGKGRELERPHSRRIALTRRTDAHVARTWQALCCQCGQLRTFTQARNRRGHWGDLNWERDLCDLKCAPCDRITTHAIVSAADHDEGGYYLVARGLKTSGNWSKDEIRRIQQQYRTGLPRNPYLSHNWRTKDLDAARERGDKQMPAACGEPIDVPETRERVERNPKEHCGECRDMEYEDPETGLWWQEMDCVDCTRLYNEEIRLWRRERLADTFMRLAARPESISDTEVDSVLEYLERLKPGGDGTG